MGVPRIVVYLEARKEVLDAFSDHSKVERVFGYKARWGLRDGLKRMADWAKSVRPAQSAPFGEIEVKTNLPATWK
jgi:UDP-glucose 4-epimerase